MPDTRTCHNKGFSLLELLLAIGILGILAVFGAALVHSARNLARVSETKERMLEIRDALTAYYKAHGDLPAPVNSSEVPVAAQALNLEQKHRLDGWGRYFRYDRVLHSVHTSRTDINGISVENRPVAGVIVSGGPDQAVETGNLGSPYKTAGDDIVLALSVNGQAMEKALGDLEMLQAKVEAFDKMFAGIDNDSDTVVDENGCVQAFGCPETGTSNDPNCSVATLDAVSASYPFCTLTVDTPAELIVGFYDLGDDLLLDPWLHPYVWGDPSTCGPADPCYHRFFSYGPDGSFGGNDDIVP